MKQTPTQNDLMQFLCLAYGLQYVSGELVIESDGSEQAAARFKSPLRDQRRDLQVRVWGQETEVSISRFWSDEYLIDFRDEGVLAAYDALKLTRFIDAVFEDRLLVIECYRSRKHCGSNLISLPATDAVPPATRREIDQRVSSQSADAYQILSWSGGFDLIEGDIGE